MYNLRRVLRRTAALLPQSYRKRPKEKQNSLMILKQDKMRKCNVKKDIFLQTRSVIYVKVNQNGVKNVEDVKTVIKAGVVYSNTW